MNYVPDVRDEWLYRCPFTGKIDPSPTCLIRSGRTHVLRHNDCRCDTCCIEGHAGPGDIVDLGTMVCPAITTEQRLAELKRRIGHVLDVANAGRAACGPWVRGELQKALAA